MADVLCDVVSEWQAFVEEALKVPESAAEHARRLSHLRRDLSTDPTLDLQDCADIMSRLDDAA